MVDSVGDVRMMHDDISVGMGGLKSFVADGLVKVRDSGSRFQMLAAAGLACDCDFGCDAADARCSQSRCPEQCRPRQPTQEAL